VLDCASGDNALEALLCVSAVVTMGVRAEEVGAAPAVTEAAGAGDAVLGALEANVDDLPRDVPASALCSRGSPTLVDGEAVPSCSVGRQRKPTTQILTARLRTPDLLNFAFFSDVSAFRSYFRFWLVPP
jgi:hypothetical protein